nr:reverse transcriptase domain-containing protein [Tanacetum cinerariifolium]
MSYYEDSTITYTSVSSPFGGLSDIGSPGVGGPPVMPKDPYAYVVADFQAPPSLDYVSGPEYPPSPEFIPELVYPNFMPAEDDILSAKEQPLLAAASPATEFDPDKDPDDDREDDPEEGLADYPAGGGDEGDDEDESSDDDEDDDIDIEGDEEEDEYLAPADSTAVALPAIDHAPSAEETEPFETDKSAATPPPHPVYRVTAKMSIIPQTPISLPSDTKITRLMAIPTPPPSPLSLLSSPLPHIPSSPLPLLSPPPTDPTYKEATLGYRAARLRGRAETGDIPRLKEPVKDDLYSFLDTVKRGEGSMPANMEVGYGITDTWDDLVGAIYETAPTTVEGRRNRMTRLYKEPESTDYSRDTSGGDQGVTGSTPQPTGIVYTGTDCTEVMSDSANCSSGCIEILEAARVPAQPEANDALMKNIQTQMTSLTNSNIDLKSMFGQFMKMYTASSSGSGSLPSNTVPNLQKDLKAITTQSGVTLAGPSVSLPPPPPSKEVDREPEMITDQVLTGSTNNVPPPVVQPSPAFTSSTPISSPKMLEVTKDTNEITRFTQNFEETFGEAWERFKEMLRQCPHHGFSELHQIDTFYNGLNEHEQDSLNASTGGNLLKKTPRDALTIIENKLKVFYSRNKSVAFKVGTTSSGNSSSTNARVDKLTDTISNLVETFNKKMTTPATVKAVEETCVIYGDKQVEGMARHKEMYIISSHTKKIFANMRRIGAGFSRVITPLFDIMMVQVPADMGDTPVETHQTPIVDQPSTSKPQKKQKPRRKQRKEAEVSNDESEDEDHVPTPSSDPLPSGEDSFILNELMVFCTSLQEQGMTNDDEMFRVNDLAGEEVVIDTTTGKNEQQIIEDVSTAEPVTTAGEVVTTTSVKDSAAPTTDVTKDEITMAQALAALKSIKPKVVVQEQETSTIILASATTVTTVVPTPKAKGIVFHEQKQSQIPIVSLSKDKCKAKTIEHEVPIKKKDQMRINEEYARKLEAKEQEAARLSRA